MVTTLDLDPKVSGSIPAATQSCLSFSHLSYVENNLPDLYAKNVSCVCTGEDVEFAYMLEHFLDGY